MLYYVYMTARSDEGSTEDEDEDSSVTQDDSATDYIYPQLVLGGAVCAAALACLGEVDAQVIIIGDRKQSGTIVTGCYMIGVHTGPTGVGCLSAINYPDFFVHPSCTLTFTKAAMTGVAEQSGSSFCPKNNYYIYTPAVRLAGLEAFIKLCLTQLMSFQEKLEKMPHSKGGDQNSNNTLGSPTKAAPKIVPLMIPAIIEAVLHVITQDPDRRTRRVCTVQYHILYRHTS